jgi:hypothetical protein
MGKETGGNDPPNITAGKRPTPVPTPDKRTPATQLPDPKSIERNEYMLRFEFNVNQGKKIVTTFNAYEKTRATVEQLFIKDPSMHIIPLMSWPERFEKPASTASEAKVQSKIMKMAEFPSTTLTFKEYFETAATEYHPQEGNKSVIRMMVESDYNLSDIKDPDLVSFLQENKLWITKSSFKSINECSVGWLLEAHTVLTNRDELTGRIKTALAQAIADDPKLGTSAILFRTVSNKRAKQSMEEDEQAKTGSKDSPMIPSFILQMKTISTGKGENAVSTKAIKIRCEKSNEKRLTELLAAASDKKFMQSKFIPFGIQEDAPHVVQGAILAHNRYMHQSVLIKVEGLKTGGLDVPLLPEDSDHTTLREVFMATKFFSSIDSAVYENSTGKHFFITDKVNEAKAKLYLDSTFRDEFEQWDWDTKSEIVLDGFDWPRRTRSPAMQSSTISSYLQSLSTSIPQWVSDASTTPTPRHYKRDNGWKKPPQAIYSVETPSNSGKPLKKTTKRIQSHSDSISASSSVETTNTRNTIASTAKTFTTMEDHFEKRLEEMAALLTSTQAELKRTIDQRVKDALDDALPALMTSVHSIVASTVVDAVSSLTSSIAEQTISISGQSDTVSALSTQSRALSSSMTEQKSEMRQIRELLTKLVNAPPSTPTPTLSSVEYPAQGEQSMILASSPVQNNDDGHGIQHQQQPMSMDQSIDMPRRGRYRYQWISPEGTRYRCCAPSGEGDTPSGPGRTEQVWTPTSASPERPDQYYYMESDEYWERQNRPNNPYEEEQHDTDLNQRPGPLPRTPQRSGIMIPQLHSPDVPLTQPSSTPSHNRSPARRSLDAQLEKIKPLANPSDQRESGGANN